MDVDDILQFPESSTITPMNNNEYHNQSLLCLTDSKTDLMEVANQCTRRGSWYYPNENPGSNNFQRNRGSNLVINDRQF